MKFAKVAASAAIFAATLSVLPSAQAAPQIQPWKAPIDASITEGSPLDLCIDKAAIDRPENWTCLGGQLTTRTVDSAGKVQIKQQDVVPYEVVDLGSISTADDYDTWCENGTICARTINGSYIAEVKGNAAYGDSSGAIGSFDQINRQAFNGAYPRWRAALDWDSGPTITPQEFIIKCRRSDALQDSTCGSRLIYFQAIGAGTQRAWFPSATGYYQNSQALAGPASTKYHDDFAGDFSASGRIWGTGTLHTGRWNNCTACRYYQVPWTNTP